jgi:hypothetical protein
MVCTPEKVAIATLFVLSLLWSKGMMEKKNSIFVWYGWPWKIFIKGRENNRKGKRGREGRGKGELIWVGSRDLQKGEERVGIRRECLPGFAEKWETKRR